MSAFTDALSAFIAAEREHAALVEKERQWMQIAAVALAVETSAQVLAQAGDVLEAELRKMMRQEVRNSGAEVDPDWLRGHRQEVGYGEP